MSPADHPCTVSDAKKPFDPSAKSDIILRSSNSVDFFVLKSFLSFASPVFDNMFSINQTSTCEGDDTRNGLPIIPMAEDNETLYNLLQLIYPFGTEPTDLGVYAKVGEAARKYAMDGALRKFNKYIQSSAMAKREPLRAFAIGVGFRWAVVMRKAAWNTLAMRLRDLNYCEELRMLSGAEYHSLLQWRFACQDALEELFNQWHDPSAESGPAVKSPRAQIAVRLRKRLRETGCPCSEALMDKSVQVVALSSQASRHRNVLDAIKPITTKIDRVVAQVPLKINGIWVVPPTQSIAIK